MNATSLVSQAEFGTPIKKVELDVHKKQKNFEEISKNLSNYGHATDTVLQMVQLTWYLTDREYLVCGDEYDPELPKITVRLIMDDNLAWLIKRAGRKHWKDFGTLVRIARNELDHFKTLILLEEPEARPAALTF